MKKVIALSVLLVLVLTGCTEGCSRTFKSIDSNWNGGLNRTLKVYDNQGHVLATYEGKFDIQESQNKVLFDLDGRRHAIYNGTVIVDEK